VKIVQLRSEGLHVVHLGDLGHALNDEEVASLRGADIVLIPAGGPPTIDFPLIAPLLEAIGPRVVVPMHFLISGKINLKIQPVERFLEDLREWPVVKRKASSIELTRDLVPASRTIVRLEPAR